MKFRLEATTRSKIISYLAVVVFMGAGYAQNTVYTLVGLALLILSLAQTQIVAVERT